MLAAGYHQRPEASLTTQECNQLLAPWDQFREWERCHPSISRLWFVSSKVSIHQTA